MLSPMRSCLDCSKVYVMSEKYGSWHGIKTDMLRITYYIFSTLIPKSVLVFFTFTPPLFDDSNLIIVIRLYPVIFPLPFRSVPLGVF